MPTLHVTVTERGGPEATVKELIGSLNAGIAAGIEWWHREIFPKHFKVGAVRQYVYRKRSKSHMLRKARRFHHQRPLVWTGRLEREMTRYLRVDTLKTKARGRGKMHGPGYKNLYASELTETRPDESKRIAKIIDRVSTQQLKALRGSTARRVT